MQWTTGRTLWLANGLILGVCIWAAVGLGMTVLGRVLEARTPAVRSAGPLVPEPIQSKPLAEYQAIVRHNMFRAPTRSAADASSAPLSDAPAAGSEGGFRLRGAVAGDKSRSMAILENQTTGEQDLYKVGDLVGGARLTSVERDKVLLQKGGQTIELPLFVDAIAASGDGLGSGGASGADSENEGAGPKEPLPYDSGGGALSQPAGPGRYYINREQLGRQMSDLNQLLSTVVIQPNFVAGQAKGLRVAAVKAGSPAGALGIQSGDVLLSVNDVALGSPEDMINMYQQLQQMETITVGLERRGAPLTLTYVFR